MDVATDTLSHLNVEELREMVQSLRQTVSFKQATIDKLTHENALLKRLKFAAQSERFSAEQRSLLEETLDEDTQAVHDEMAELNAEPIPARVKDQPKRQPLPTNLPLYRQEAIFGRAGLAIPRSTLGAWVGSCGVQLQPLVDALKADSLTHRVVHADETPVQMLQPGHGKTHRAYLWAYAAGAFEDTKAVVYDFCASRAGENAKAFLGTWRGNLVCDDFSGYKQLMVQGVTEVGCLAHARRKFFDLHSAHKSPVAQRALEHIAQVYEIERELKACSADERQRERQERSKPLLDALHAWLLLTRQKVTDGTATAKALDYSLRRWQALTRFVDDGQLPVDNNHIENQIRPIAIGRNNWLFAGSLRAGQRGAAVMSDSKRSAQWS